MPYLLSIIVGFVLWTSSGCKEIRPPRVPTCTILSETIICEIPSGFDVPSACTPTGELEEYQCEMAEAFGYQCTSPRGFEILRSDIDEKYTELAKLRKVCGQGRSKKNR